MSMTIPTTSLEPFFSYITADLTGATTALDITDRVLAALEAGAEYHAATAFLRTAGECRTEEELLYLANAIVTVIQ